MHTRAFAPTLASLAVLGISLAGFAQTRPADRLLAPIVASQRTVTNLVHPLALRQNDLGRVNPTQVFHRMVLLLERSPAQEADLRQLLEQQQDPASPEYHKWLTPAEFGQRFGPSANDMAKITGWLQSQGFSVEAPSNGRQFILFTGTSAQVETAFQTEMHRYSLNGKTYFANAKPASIPSVLAPAVRGVASLTSFGNFKPQSYTAATPQIAFGQAAITGPADLDAIYDATPLRQSGIEGQGQSIALIEESNINVQDLADFRSLTGLPPANINVIVNGPDPGKLVYDYEEFEAISDAEYAGAMDPDATLNMIVTASTEFNQGIDLSTVYAVDHMISPITALSYGGCETLNDAYYTNTVLLYAAAYEQGAAEGISHFVSSGDNGGDDCEYTGLSAGYGVNAIGDSPWNVSVGGTEFIMPDPNVYFPPSNKYTATGYIPESTWNDYENPYDGRPLAGNGGVSIYFNSLTDPSLGIGKPAWQAGPGVPNDNGRDTPDVSLVAGDNLAYLTCEQDIGYDCANGAAGGVLGTSLAAQTWAGIQALVNQKNNLVGGAGNPDPIYYRLAAGAHSPFHDITIGDTKVPDPNGNLVGYVATPGFDLATGLGSVDVNALAAAWALATGSGSATVTLSTGGVTGITHGDPVTASIHVSGSGSAAPTGDVVILAATQGVYQATLDASGDASISFGNSSLPLSQQVELPGGSYSLSARYAGDANFAPANSNSIAMTVSPEPTRTVASTTYVTSSYGTPVTITADSYGTNSGTNFPVPGVYTFTSNGITLGTASLADTGEGFAYAAMQNSASLTLSGATALGAGTHVINASSPPAGASYLASSTTTPVTVVVTMSPALVSLTPSYTTPALNSTVKLQASVYNATAFNAGLSAVTPVTGTVRFVDLSTSPSTTLGTLTLPSAADSTGMFDVTLPVSFHTPGMHQLVAMYSGDANDNAGTSGAADVTVGAGAASSTTTIEPSGGVIFDFTTTGFALAQSNVSFAATVTGNSSGANPSGSVNFNDMGANNGAGAAIGAAAIGKGGVATLTTDTLAGGMHYIVANYPGDANFAASGSKALDVMVGDFTLTAASSSATVEAGQSTAPIALTYAGNTDFSTWLAAAGAPAGAAVQLSCSGLPAGAACSFSKAVITPTANANGTTSGTANVTISTTGPTLEQGSSHAPRRPGTGAGALALAGVLALGLPFAWRRHRQFSALLAVALLAIAAGMNGCGSSSFTKALTITSPGTPAGTSAVTVTATVNGGPYLGAVSHSVTVNLTVTALAQ